MLRFLESLVPVFKNCSSSRSVSLWTVEKLIENLERHCPDMRTRHSRCDHMIRHTQRCREDLSLIAVVVEYLHDLLDHLHAVDTDVVKAANKRTHDVGTVVFAASNACAAVKTSVTLTRMPSFERREQARIPSRVREP